MGPAWPMPAGASSCSAPGWARVFKDLAAAHAAPPGGFDLTAFGRVVTVGPTGGAGGFRLSDEALLELASFLSAPGAAHGPAPPAGRPPPAGTFGGHTAGSAGPPTPLAAAGPGGGLADVAAAAGGPPPPPPPAAAAGAAPGYAAAAAGPGLEAEALPPPAGASGTSRAIAAYRRALLEELFLILDTDGDGRLAAGELELALPG